MKVKITLLLLVFFSLYSFISYGGNSTKVNRGEVIEHLWADNEKAWEKSMIQSLHSSDADFKTFLKFYSDKFAKVRSTFFAKAFRGEINEGNASDYFARITNTYKVLYHKFQNIKKEYPSSVNEYTTERPVNPHNTTGACNPACTNLDFSSGNFSGWNAYYATNDLGYTNKFGTSALVGGPAGAVTQAANDPNTLTYQATIMSGVGVDPYAGALIPVAAPLGNYSARVGDTTTGFGVGELTNQFTVPSVAVPVLTIQYAVVLEHTYAHTFYSQPWFQVTIVDQNGNPIPGCGQYFVVAYDTLNYLKNFVPVPHPANGDTMFCRPWTSVFVPLNGYQGQCVTLSFEASDCNGGAHLGYAYVAASCSQLQVQSSSTTFCGQSSITLTSPPGGTYQWIGPCISGSTTQQTATVTCAGTYSVIISSSSNGPACVDTLAITVTTSPGTPPAPAFKADTVCAGTPTKFTNLSNPVTGPGVKFYWDFFNNGKFEDSTTSPTWTFTQGGVYLVRLHETVNGCGMDTTIKVVVDTANVLSFSSFSACSGQPSSFFMSSTTTTPFEWNFGDPASGANDTSTSSFPTHIFTSAGTYLVSLKTLGGHCPDSSTQAITVGASPVAKIITSQASCTDSTITFRDADSTNIAEYEWEAFTSTGTFVGFKFSTSSATASGTFPGPGTYLIVLYSFSNPSFCEGIDSLNITIGSAPKAAFNVLPDSACIHKITQFNDASTGAPSAWSWNFGDPGSGVNNTSTKQNPTHIYSSAGNYTVKLVVNPGTGCTDSITKIVPVTEVAGNFNVNSVCLHDTTKFANTSTVANGNIKGWQWNFGDGNTSILQNPTHVYNIAGTYNVTLTVTSTTGCDSVIVKTVTVEPAPSPFFTFSRACLGAQTQFTDLSTDPSGTITSWNWSFGDGGTSTLQNPSHTYGAVGIYNAVLVVTSSTGCADSIKHVVSVNPIPTVLFSADSLAGCAPLCVDFADNTTISAGGLSTWLWNFGNGGGTATTQNAVYCYTSPGTFTVSLTVTSDSGCKAQLTIPKMITAYDYPHPSFTATPQPANIMEPFIQFTDKTVDQYGIQSWFWTFGDATDSTSTIQNPGHTYKDTGTFCPTLVVTNKHQCTSSVEECIVIDPVFTLYIPNAFTPNGNGLNESFGPVGNYIKVYDMYIFNRWGNMIYHTSDLTKPWDGTVSGNKMEEDTYVYLINVVDTRNQKHNYLGRVTLLR